MFDNVSKLKIISYADAGRMIPGLSMEAMVNPESYSLHTRIQYSDKQAPGTTGKLPKFSKIEPQKLELELLFDSTGVINGLFNNDLGVDVQLLLFKTITLEYKGDKHRPRFLCLFWGTLKFDCCLESLDITYKLFRPSGLPIRATVRATFIGSIDDVRRVAMEQASSPDLTHLVTVNEGDTLPLMAFRIYGDSKYYREVAKANNLDDFRNLTPGMQLFFPPLTR